MPFGLGFGEMILIFAVLLLFFGAKRLPEVAGGLGKGIRDFKRALNGLDAESLQAGSQAQPLAAPAQAQAVAAPAQPAAAPTTPEQQLPAQD
jgi:sec-independent protein translocase protein TatA